MAFPSLTLHFSGSSFRRRSGRTTQLANELPLAASGISRSVTKLADMGFIRRRRLRTDRRVVALTLTGDGLALAQDLHRRIQAHESTLREGVSEEEMAVFASVSSRIMTNLVALGVGTGIPGDPREHEVRAE